MSQNVTMTMDPTDFLKALPTRNSSTRTMDTEDVTHQSSFSASGDDTYDVTSTSLDFDLHQIGSVHADSVGVTQHRSGYDFRGNESTDSFMLEESFALGESFSYGGAEDGSSCASLLLGEVWSPMQRRLPRERPDLSTVIDIEEEEEDMIDMEEEGDDEKRDDSCGNDVECVRHGSLFLKTRTSRTSVEVQQG
jgi:hypothetical protein